VVPVIGVTSFDEHKNRSVYVSININYAYSVAASGGLPFVLPGPSGLPSGDEETEAFARDYVRRLDGLVLSGGGDIAPYLYGESPSAGVARMDSARDRWELALFSAARARGLPILGVCRGCQLVNAALGGTLYQDIKGQLPLAGGHSFDMPMDEPAHYVDIVPDTRLAAMFGEGRVLANSFHHQAVKDLAPGLVVSARAPDGVVEAVEAVDREPFLVAVQFHPEGMSRRYPEFLAPFAALSQAAASFRAASGLA